MKALDYFNALRAHDWYFHFSDDPHVYRKGETTQRELIKWAFTSHEHTRLFNEWHAHKLHKGPRPTPPKENK